MDQMDGGFPPFGQRKFNQEEEGDGGENGEAIPKMRKGYSLRPFQLTLVHVGPLILQARAGNLLSLIVSGTMTLGLI